VTACLSAAALALTACGSSGSGSGGGSAAAGSGSQSTAASGSGSGKRLQIVMLLNDQFDPYYLTLVKGAEEEAKKSNIDFSWQAPTTLDVASQTQLLQSVAAKKPDGIIMSAIDADAMSAPMKQVQSSGIPIMTVDSDVSDASARLGTVKSDGLATGKAAAKEMNTLLKGSGQVGYVGYTPGIQSVDQRLAGWKDGLKGYSGLEKVGEQYAGADTSENVAKASALIAKSPNLKAIFASWTNASIGTAQAVQQTGKKIDVIGVDAAPDEVSLLKSGAITALVAQKPAEMGRIAIDDLAAFVRNGTKPKSSQLLDSVVITTAQANDPKFSQYFYVKPTKSK
jgi:ribose transport system substrate-binding protein